MENYLKLQEKQNMETVLRLNKRCKKMDWAFFKKDLQYIFLNQIVSSIPSWTIRNFFYKCSGMKIGPKARIGINTVIISPKGITIGCRSVINDHCVLDGSGGITIKNDVSISAFTKIYSCTHKTDSDFFEYITNPTVEVIDVCADEDNDSLVLLITYGNTKFLFTGDIEDAAQTRISDRYQSESDEPYKIDLIKMPHHGSYTGTLYRFLRTFMPDYAVISVGAGNSYGHPRRETLDLLDSKTWKPMLYRTDQNGDIFVKSNGKELTVETAR